MSENHDQKADITALKASKDEDARLAGESMSFGDVLDEEDPIVGQNILLANVLKRMKEKYRNSERGMLQLRTWEARAATGKARAHYVFTPDAGVGVDLLTTRRIIGLLTHPKELRTDERVKDALLIAGHAGSDYIDDGIADLVSVINRGGVTGDTESKVKVLQHGGSAGLSLLNTNGLRLPEGFGTAFASAWENHGNGLEEDRKRANAAAWRFVSNAFGHLDYIGSYVFHELRINGGLWNSIDSIAPKTHGSNGMRMPRGMDMTDCLLRDYMACMDGMTRMDSPQYAGMLAMYIWAHDLIAAVGDYGRKHGFLPHGWRGGLVFNGTAEDLAIWMGANYGYLPDDSDEKLNDDTYRMHNDDGNVSLTLPGAVLWMPDGKPNFGPSFKPVLTVEHQECDSKDLPWA